MGLMGEEGERGGSYLGSEPSSPTGAFWSNGVLKQDGRKKNVFVLFPKVFSLFCFVFPAAFIPNAGFKGMTSEMETIPMLVSPPSVFF